MLLALSLLAALAIFLKGLFYAINHMDRRTSHCMRIAWLTMTAGSAGILLEPVSGAWRSPTLWEAAVLVGVAFYLVFERRRSGQIRGMP